MPQASIVLDCSDNFATRHTVNRACVKHRKPLVSGAAIRFDAQLIFANARTFREQIRKLTRSQPSPKWIIVAAEPITDVDTTAADMLGDIDEELNASDVHLVFAEMKDPVRRKIDRYELTRTIDTSHFFPTVEAAVDAFQKNTGAEWGQAARDEEN